MRKLLFLTAALVAATVSADSTENEDFMPFYAGVSGQMLLPQGGSRLSPRAGCAVRAGWYAVDTLAFETECAVLERRVGLAAQGLLHLRGLEWYNALFGYERFDPFATLGARGWLHDGTVGPSVGVGAFYYLTDSWALRFDANVTLGLDTRTEADYSLSVGVQYSFF